MVERVAYNRKNAKNEKTQKGRARQFFDKWKGRIMVGAAGMVLVGAGMTGCSKPEQESKSIKEDKVKSANEDAQVIPETEESKAPQVEKTKADKYYEEIWAKYFPGEKPPENPTWKFYEDEKGLAIVPFYDTSKYEFVKMQNESEPCPKDCVCRPVRAMDELVFRKKVNSAPAPKPLKSYNPEKFTSVKPIVEIIVE